MAIVFVNVGAAPNDGTGDLLRDGFIKINSNFGEIQVSLGAITTIEADITAIQGDIAALQTDLADKADDDNVIHATGLNPEFKEGPITFEDNVFLPNIVTDTTQTVALVGIGTVSRRLVQLPPDENIEIIVVNKTGAIIPKGAVVYVNGAQGNKPTIALAVADANIDNSFAIGIVEEDIANNAVDGRIVTNGVIERLNTSAFNEGDKVFLSPTVPGGLVNTVPASPDNVIFIGTVISSHASLGKILVSIGLTFKIDRLIDVTIVNPINNEVLTYVDGFWKNLPSSGGGATPPVFDIDTDGLVPAPLTVAGRFLSDDGQWVIPAVTGAQSFMLTNVASDVGTHKKLVRLEAYTQGAIANITTAVSSSVDTLMGTFITEPNFPALTKLNIGTGFANFVTQKASGTVGYYNYFTLTRYSATTGEDASPLLTSANTSVQAGNGALQQVAFIQNPAFIELDPTDRIIIKIYGRLTTGANTNITLSFDNGTNARFQSPYANNSVYELLTNKQNDLTPDATNTKYPTVSAVIAGIAAGGGGTTPNLQAVLNQSGSAVDKSIDLSETATGKYISVSYDGVIEFGIAGGNYIELNLAHAMWTNGTTASNELQWDKTTPGFAVYRYPEKPTGTYIFPMSVNNVVPDAAGNITVTKRVNLFASAATVTPNASTDDIFKVNDSYLTDTTVAFAAPSGTKVNGQMLMIMVKDNGTPRNLTWALGTSGDYIATTDFALPSTTIINKWMRLLFQWNADSATNRWELIGIVNS